MTTGVGCDLPAGVIHVELGLVVIRGVIDDVGMHFVTEQLGGECRRVGLRYGHRSRKQQEGKQEFSHGFLE